MASFNKDRIPAVLLDTNILISSASKPFDIAHQLKTMGFTKVLVPSSVIWELEAISNGKSNKLGRFARLALKIAASFKQVDLTPVKPSVDDEIIAAAQAGGHTVATSDSAMRRKLQAAGITVIYLKDGRLINKDDD